MATATAAKAKPRPHFAHHKASSRRNSPAAKIPKNRKLSVVNIQARTPSQGAKGEAPSSLMPPNLTRVPTHGQSRVQCKCFASRIP